MDSTKRPKTTRNKRRQTENSYSRHSSRGGATASQTLNYRLGPEKLGIKLFIPESSSGSDFHPDKAAAHVSEAFWRHGLRRKHGSLSADLHGDPASIPGSHGLRAAGVCGSAPLANEFQRRDREGIEAPIPSETSRSTLAPVTLLENGARSGVPLLTRLGQEGMRTFRRRRRKQEHSLCSHQLCLRVSSALRPAAAGSSSGSSSVYALFLRFLIWFPFYLFL
ncbi:hypothetical protein SRHO_G00189680 [Serrasalmus rhombeus]